MERLQKTVKMSMDEDHHEGQREAVKGKAKRRKKVLCRALESIPAMPKSA